MRVRPPELTLLKVNGIKFLLKLDKKNSRETKNHTASLRLFRYFYQTHEGVLKKPVYLTVL